MILDERVLARLASETRFQDIRQLAEVDSTNRVVADLAAERAPEGLVVTAEFQTSGRGRLDRTWEAAPGEGLLVSVLLRPAGLPVERWHLVTAGGALAAQEACLDVAGVETTVKWPNDLLLGNPEAKLAGILAEATHGAVVVGMGLNVHSGPPGSGVLDLAAGRRVDRGLLLERWLFALDRMLGDWDAIAGMYRSRCATVGRNVEIVTTRGDTIVGRAERLDDHGRLVVRTADDDLVEVSVGDVTHLRGGGSLGSS